MNISAGKSEIALCYGRGKLARLPMYKNMAGKENSLFT